VKREYCGAEIAQLSFHDSELHGIRWENGGENLALLLTWLPPRDSPVACPASATESQLIAEYATDLSFNLVYGQFMGTPAIYAITVTPLRADRWKVAIEFVGGPDGIIVFECNELTLRLSPTE
jgi:hypothetical protein